MNLHGAASYQGTADPAAGIIKRRDSIDPALLVCELQLGGGLGAKAQHCDCGRRGMAVHLEIGGMRNLDRLRAPRALPCRITVRDLVSQPPVTRLRSPSRRTRDTRLRVAALDATIFRDAKPVARPYNE